MKKSLALLFLSFTIACSAWAEKYEYVRLTEVSKRIELQSGDIAWFVNSSDLYNTKIVQYNLDGTQLSIQSQVWNSGTNSPRYDSTFVGPCILGTKSEGTFVTLKILRASESGNKTLEWDGEKYAGTTTTNSNDDSQQANNNSPNTIKYDTLLGWCYFTDTPWLYSYTNGSWYYMKSINNEVYVWNANIPDGGWTKFRG